MSATEDPNTSRKRRSAAVLAEAKMTTLSVVAPDQVPSDLVKKSSKSPSKKKKSKGRKDSDSDSDSDSSSDSSKSHRDYECEDSDCSCGEESDKEEEVPKAKKSKKEEENKSASKEQPSKVPDSVFPPKTSPPSIPTPSSPSEVHELRRKLAQLRSMLDARDNVILEQRRTIEAKEAQIHTCVIQLKTAVVQCKEETRAVADMVHRRDAIIADLNDKAIELTCQKARAEELAAKTKIKLEKLFKDGIFRQCATGVCEENAIFRLHGGDKPHYVCAGCAVGLINAAKGDEITCPQCRFKIKGLKLEVPEGTIKSLDPYLVSEQDLDALSYESVKAQPEEYGYIRSELYEGVQVAPVANLVARLPGAQALADLRRVHQAMTNAKKDKITDEESKFYSDYPRPQVQAAQEVRPLPAARPAQRRIPAPTPAPAQVPVPAQQPGLVIDITQDEVNDLLRPVLTED